MTESGPQVSDRAVPFTFCEQAEPSAPSAPGRSLFRSTPTEIAAAYDFIIRRTGSAFTGTIRAGRPRFPRSAGRSVQHTDGIAAAYDFINPKNPESAFTKTIRAGCAVLIAGDRAHRNAAAGHMICGIPGVKRKARKVPTARRRFHFPETPSQAKDRKLQTEPNARRPNSTPPLPHY